MTIIGIIIMPINMENKNKFRMVMFFGESAIFSIIHIKIAVYKNVDKILN